MLKIHLAQIHYNQAYYEPPIDYLEEPVLYMQNDTPMGQLREIQEINHFLTESKESYLDHIKKKIISIVDWSGIRGADIIVFPEYSIPCQLLPYLKSLSSKYSILIISGTHRVTSDETDKNIYNSLNILPQCVPVGCACAPVFLPDGSTEITSKLKKSKWEPNLKIINSEPLLIKAKTKNISEYIHFCVIPCIDSLHLDVVGKLWANNISRSKLIIFCPSLSPLTEPFKDMSSLLRLKETLFCYVNIASFGESFFNIPDIWTTYLSGPIFGSRTLPEGSEAILELEIDPRSFYLKMGSIDSTPMCNHPIPYPIVYKKISPWLHAFEKLKKNLFSLMEQDEVKKTKSKLDHFLLEYSDKIPPLSAKILRDIRHSLIPLYSGSIDDIKKATDFVVLNEEIDSTIHYRANKVNSAIKKIAKLLISDRSTERTPLMINCLGSLKKAERKLPLADVSTEGEKVFGDNHTLSFSSEENLIESFQNRGSDLDIIRNFFANEENRVILVTGSIGIGKSGFLDWMFKKAFGDWETLKIFVPPEVRFTRIVADFAYKLGIGIDSDAIGAASYKLYRHKIQKLFKKFYSVPKRALIIDDMFQTFKQKNARDYKHMAIFFEEATKPKDYQGGRIFIASSSWVPDKWLHTAGVSHIRLKGISDIYIRRIIEYQMRRANLVLGEKIPEPPQNLLDLVSGHPLSAKLVVEAIHDKDMVQLNKELTIEKITGHVARELLKKITFNESEKQILMKLSVFRLPVNLNKLINLSGFNLDKLDLKELANRCLISFDGQSITMHEAVRRYFYYQLNNEVLPTYHGYTAIYYQDLFDDQKHKGHSLNPAILGELAYHLSLSGDISKQKDLRLFIVEEIKPAARKIYREFKNYDKALSLYKMISGIINDDPETWAYIGRCYARLGQWSDSDDAFNQALEVARRIGPTPHWIYRDWGHIRARYQFYGVAEELFEKAEERKPNDPSIKGSLAFMRWHQDQIEEACELFEKALEINPYHEYSLIYYSKLLREIGDTNYADVLAERVRNLDFSSVNIEPEEYDIEIDDLDDIDFDDMA